MIAGRHLRPTLMSVLVFLVALGWSAEGARAAEEEWRSAFQAADAYYRMSIELEGDVRSLAKAVRLAERAASLAPATHKATVEALQQSISVQQEMAAESFQGVFPLARLLAGAAPEVPLELHDPPEWLAATTAVRTLLNDLSRGERGRTQLHAVIASPPNHRHLDGEVTATARTIPGVLLHPRHVVAEALGHSQAALAELDEGRPGKDTLQRLKTALGAPDLLVGSLRVVPLEDGDAMVEARGTLVRAGSDVDDLAVAWGFNRDRRQLWLPTLAMNAALGFGIVLVGVAFLRRSNAGHGGTPDEGQEWVSRLQSAIFLASAFLAGRLLPMVLFKAMGAAVPLPDAGADLESVKWWPAVAGITLFAVPLLVWRAVSFRAAAVLREMVIHGRLGWAGAALSLGAAAYGGGLLLRYWGLDAVPAAIVFAIGAAVAGGLLGSCLDRFDALHPAFAAAALGLMALLGTTLCLAEPVYIEAAALPTAFILAGQLWSFFRQPGEITASFPDAAGRGGKWANPVVGRVWDDIGRRQPDVPLWLGILGPETCGKSTVVDELVKRMHGDGPLTVLRGSCDPISGLSAAPTYGPFEKALKGHLQGSLSSNGLDAALDATTTILLAPVTSMLGSGAGEQNVHVYVTNQIQQMADGAHVVLVIEGVQCLDGASRSLLAHLRKNFRTVPGRRLTVILEGRDEPSVEELCSYLEVTRYDVQPLDPKEQHALLKSEGLTPEAVAWVIAWNTGEGTPQTPQALREVIDHLRDHKRLIPGSANGGLRLNDQTKEVPVLASMAESVRDTLKAVPTARALLTAAACAAVSTRFDLALVAEALGRTTASVTELLDELWRRPRPLIEEDDGRHYRFVSQHALDAVRRELKAEPLGPHADLPPRVRTIYGRLADVMRGQPKTSIEDVERLALYSYAAGLQHADKAVDAAFTAAEVLMRSANQFDKAAGLMAKADEITVAAPHLRALVQRERQRMRLLESHLTNNPKMAAEQAREALKVLTDNLADPLLPAAAQGCFDGMGADRALREEAIRLAERLAGSDTPHAVEGLHIQALCHEGRSPERRELLRRALDMARGLKNREAEARITNSLAEALSLSEAAADRAEAERLFNSSIALKRTLPIPDGRGEARSRGGLGRLAYFGTPRNVNAAQKHFEEDLRLSIDFGDLRGQSQMYSLLGACAFDNGDWAKAIEMHGKTIALNVHAFDVFMSYAGLMQAHRANKDERGFRNACAAFEAAGGFDAAPEGTHRTLRAALAEAAVETA